MTKIEEIKKIMPHLIEPLNLYEKVLSFENKVGALLTGRIYINEGFYPSDLINVIIEEFSKTFGLSLDILLPLKEALMFKQIDLLRLPYNEVPAFTLPYHEEETEMILFILSRPFFINLRKMLEHNDALTENGRCPVCHSTPCISSIQENEEKIFYCSFCSHQGKWSRIGCPACLNRRGEDIEIILTDELQGLRLELCRSCKNYIKTFQRAVFTNYSPSLIDIISLPLDIIAKSKGFIRPSPNPLGMKRIL